MLDFYKNKKVLVTGGAGFIGSSIVEELINLQAQVRVLDNLSTGDINNLTPVIDAIEFIQADIRDFNTCMQAVQDVDIIFHLAAMASIMESTKDPHLCHDINVTGTFNLLEAARLNNIKTFIFSSSSSVYGNSSNLNKETDPCQPLSHYAVSKLIGEQYCALYAKMGVNTIALRYFNVYGGRQKCHNAYAAVVAKFRFCIQNGQPITIFGDGLQMRDFIAVEKVVEYNLKAAILTPAQLNGQPVNIATGKSITLLDLIDLIKAKEGKSNVDIRFMAARESDISVSLADCTKLKQILQV